MKVVWLTPQGTVLFHLLIWFSLPSAFLPAVVVQELLLGETQTLYNLIVNLIRIKL